MQLKGKYAASDFRIKYKYNIWHPIKIKIHNNYEIVVLQKQ